MVNAIPNGKTRQFDELTWKEMPRDKYGWQLAADVPDEVKAYKERVVTAVDIKNNPDLSGLQGKVVGLPVTAITPEEEIVKIQAELAGTSLHHNTRKKLEKRLQELTAPAADATGNESDTDQTNTADATGNE